MIDRSLAIVPRNDSQAGSRPTPHSPARFEIPAHIASALALCGSYFEYADQVRGLARAKHDGFLEAIPALADRALAALAPVDEKALLDRLTMLGMSMAHGKAPEEQTAWLHEATRLLSDLPQAIVFDAIDECVKEPGRVFAPSVGEIRAKAAGPLQQREREAARLRRLAILIAEGAEIPDWIRPDYVASAPPPPEPVCTPEEATAILAEFGIKSLFAEKLAGMLKPEQPKSRADMIAEGIEPPCIVPPNGDDRITV
jgi:hypothetical protein